ncbi:hypothetical protein ABH917_000797 [Thermobifida halotolerans]
MLARLLRVRGMSDECVNKMLQAGSEVGIPFGIPGRLGVGSPRALARSFRAVSTPVSVMLSLFSLRFEPTDRM